MDSLFSKTPAVECPLGPTLQLHIFNKVDSKRIYNTRCKFLPVHWASNLITRQLVISNSLATGLSKTANDNSFPTACIAPSDMMRACQQEGGMQTTASLISLCPKTIQHVVSSVMESTIQFWWETKNCRNCQRAFSVLPLQN